MHGKTRVAALRDYSVFNDLSLHKVESADPGECNLTPEDVADMLAEISDHFTRLDIGDRLIKISFPSDQHLFNFV
jgi:hypothetical protein